jgi:hypothetical protein
MHRASFYFDFRLREALARTRTLNALQTILRESVPRSIAAELRVRRLDEGILYLAAATGGAAAKTREMLPTLQQRFCRHGFELKGIRVSVDRKPRRRIERERARFDPLAQRHLEKLAARLEDSPLKRAVQKLANPKSGKESFEREE